MFCTECGTQNKDTATFCRRCGVRLDDDETHVAQRAAPSQTEATGGEEDEEATRLSRRGDVRPDSLAPEFAYMPPSAAGTFIADRTQPASVTAAMYARGPDPKPIGEDEHEIFSISPTLMFVKAGYVLAAVGALLLVALVSWLAGSLVPTTLAVLFGLGLFLVPAYYHICQRIIRYRLTGTKLQLDTGLVARQTRNVPLRRIQDVTVTTNILQRLLGFGDIVIDNASEEGGKVVVKNIGSPRKYADMLLKQMSRLER